MLKLILSCSCTSLRTWYTHTNLWKVLGYLFDVSSLWSNDKSMQPAVNSDFILYNTVSLHATHLNTLPCEPHHTHKINVINNITSVLTLSVYRSRFEALPSIGPAFFAEQMVKHSNNATENGHIYARGIADGCYRLGCDLWRTDRRTQGRSIYGQRIASSGKNI